MNMKNFSPLIAAISLGLCLSTVTINPAQSSEVTDNNGNDILISQLRGHDSFDGNSQRLWQKYSMGRVVGKSGDKIFIDVEDGGSFQADGYVRPYTYIRPGSDVIVGTDSNGEYYLVSATKSEWISRLETDYGLDRNEIAITPLNERTAPIWAALEAPDTMTVTQILGTETTPNIPERQYTSPVRGLW